MFAEISWYVGNTTESLYIILLDNPEKRKVLAGVPTYDDEPLRLCKVKPRQKYQ
jgi:hypothetical protein